MTSPAPSSAPEAGLDFCSAGLLAPGKRHKHHKWGIPALQDPDSAGAGNPKPELFTAFPHSRGHECTSWQGQDPLHIPHIHKSALVQVCRALADTQNSNPPFPGLAEKRSSPRMTSPSPRNNHQPLSVLTI